MKAGAATGGLVTRVGSASGVVGGAGMTGEGASVVRGAPAVADECRSEAPSSPRRVTPRRLLVGLGTTEPAALRGAAPLRSEAPRRRPVSVDFGDLAGFLALVALDEDCLAVTALARRLRPAPLPEPFPIGGLSGRGGRFGPDGAGPAAPAPDGGDEGPLGGASGPAAPGRSGDTGGSVRDRRRSQSVGGPSSSMPVPRSGVGREVVARPPRRVPSAPAPSPDGHVVRWRRPHRPPRVDRSRFGPRWHRPRPRPLRDPRPHRRAQRHRPRPAQHSGGRQPRPGGPRPCRPARPPAARPPRGAPPVPATGEPAGPATVVVP